jgi:hypothetical protein
MTEPPTLPIDPAGASDRFVARVLAPFAKVEPAEAITAATLTLNVFLLLTAYYFLKTAREPLILLHGGAEVKAYASAGQSLLLLLVIPAYAALAKRVDRTRLVLSVYGFFAMNLLIFALLARGDYNIGVAFYLWVGVFNNTAIAQFWSFSNDVYTPEQGQRVFAVLGIGSSVGAVAGAMLAKRFAAAGPAAMMLGAALLLVVCMLLFAWINRREQGTQRQNVEVIEEPLLQGSAFAVLMRDRYLLWIAALTFLLNCVNSTGEYLLDRTLLAAVKQSVSAHDASSFISAFKADYFGWVNLCGTFAALRSLANSQATRRAACALHIAGGGVRQLQRDVDCTDFVADTHRQDRGKQSRLFDTEHVAPSAVFGRHARREIFGQDRHRHFGRAHRRRIFRHDDLHRRAARPAHPSLCLAQPRLHRVLDPRARRARTRACATRTSVACRGARDVSTSRSRLRLPRTAAAKLYSSLACLALCWLIASSARADLPKRNVPDYDGREEPTTVGDVLLWVPRIVLSPLYLVSEFVVRRPLGFLISSAERANVPELLYDFFTFGPEHSAGIVPFAFYDFGFYPSVGLFLFWNDAFAARNSFSLRASAWDHDWLSGTLVDRVHIDTKTDIVIQATGTRRPDYAYFGIGPRSLESDITRYGESRLDASLGLDVALGPLGRLSTAFGGRRAHFHHGNHDGDPALDRQIAHGVIAAPDGYPDGYTLLYDRVSIALDSRKPRPAAGSGVRFEAKAEQMSDMEHQATAGYLRYGANLGGFYDLNDHRRVVSLSFGVTFADPLGHQAVPFTELATLGGSESMRGFLPGRLYGRSSAVTTLRYRWPIWIWLDGSIQFAMGNVFDKHLEGFAPGLFRLSGSIGIESVGSSDSSLELLVGFGTETFEHGTQITSARVYLATNHGF